MRDNFNKIKISLILNSLIVIFTIFASVIMFSGIKIMHGMEPVLESSTFGMFRFFTVDSNLLIGIISLIFLLKERQLLLGKIKRISTWYYILKLIGTVSVTLTFLVVMFYLAPISPGGIMSMLQNSNLFFHLIIPVLSITTFCFFENTSKIRFRKNLYSLIPTFGYTIFYLTNVLIHLENGVVSTKYDWYWFVQGGLHQIYIVIPSMLLITLIISIILWIINRKNFKKK